MAFLEDLLKQQFAAAPVGADLGLRKGQAYSSFFPEYEISTPQYTQPNPYQMAQIGYRTNELVYALISKRAKALSEASIYVYDDNGETPEEIDNHPLRRLLKRANQGIGEKMFWQITSIYRDIAGSAMWEIERNQLGEPMRLWPMMPHYCSTLRGQQQIIRAIRYQPYGLPPADIPIENVLMFGTFDPLYYGSRFISPTMIAMEQIGVDNSMTAFLLDFVKHGAKFSGLLSVAQTIDETTALDYKRRFKDSHGGTQNWSDPLVLGLGAKYESMQMNFRDMAFPELDARTESKICMAFEMSPILVSAKVGLDRSTFSNYEQASKSWYAEWVNPEWQSLADTLGEQILPIYHDDTENIYCEFDTSNVLALQEDRTQQAERATKIYKDGIARLNEAREEMGLDPVDDEEGEQFYKAPAPIAKDVTNEPKQTETQPVPPQLQQDVTSVEDDEQAQEEVKAFRQFAQNAIKRGHPEHIFEFEFKFVPVEQQADLMARYQIVKNDNGAAEVLMGIKSALRAIDRQAQPMVIELHQGAITPPNVTVVNRVEPTPVTVTQPEHKMKRAKLTKNNDGSITIE